MSIPRDASLLLRAIRRYSAAALVAPVACGPSEPADSHDTPPKVQDKASNAPAQGSAKLDRRAKPGIEEPDAFYAAAKGAGPGSGSVPPSGQASDKGARPGSGSVQPSGQASAKGARPGSGSVQRSGQASAKGARPGSGSVQASGQASAKGAGSGSGSVQASGHAAAKGAGSDSSSAQAKGQGKSSAGRSAPGAVPAPIVGYLLGDPPYVEGWDPEEETCVSGNWCGPASAAIPLTRPGMEGPKYQRLGCPTKLIGTRDFKLEGPAYRGLSADLSMRGTLQTYRTQKARTARKDPTLCCYHWFEYCSGRIVDDGSRTQMARTQVARTRDEASGAMCDPVARALARAYLDDADDEMDSVAALARATLELFALGAPEALLAGCQRASLDELRHARMAREISRRFARLEPSPRPAISVQPREACLARLLTDTLREACVGESLAALRVQRQAQQATRPAIRAALLQISQDEARHAALGFEILRWGLGQASCEVRATLRQAAHGLEQELLGPRPDAPAHEDRIERSPAWKQGGRLTHAQRYAASRDAFVGIVRPILEELQLLDGGGASRET